MKFILFTLLMGITFFHSNTVNAAGAKEARQTVIKFATAQSPASLRTQSIEYFKAKVEEKSGGKIRVDICSAGALGSEREALEGQKLGTVEMLVGDQVPNIVPVIGVFTLPFLFKDRDHAYRVFDGPIGEKVLKDLQKQGIQGFPNGYWENGFRSITNNVRPINAPEDLRGLKMRVVGQDVYVEFMKALGALPVSMPFGEVYTALQLGTVDGQDNPMTNIYNGKFHEVQKHLAITEHIYSTVMVTGSARWWQGLSKDNQEIIYSAVGEATKWNREQMQKDEKASFDKMLVERSMLAVTRPDKRPFAEIMRQIVYPKFEAAYGKQLIEEILTY